MADRHDQLDESSVTITFHPPSGISSLQHAECIRLIHHRLKHITHYTLHITHYTLHFARYDTSLNKCLIQYDLKQRLYL